MIKRDPRWYWFQMALRKMYGEIDHGVPDSLTIIFIEDGDIFAYSMSPETGGTIDKRIITSPTALAYAADATTVCANVEDFIS